MAAAKKSVYISVELDWAEEQLAQWKAYVEANPLPSLTDRMDYKETAKGGIIKTVIASIEQQGKFIQETMKNYLILLGEVDRMREQESKKVETRGKGEISTQADEWLQSRQ